MILSHTKIFNIFPGSVQTSFVIGIISSFCSRYKCTQVSKRDFWVKGVYFDISNSTSKQCLKNTTNVNDLGPAKFGTQAENNNEQICYYNSNKKDTNSNSSLAVKKQASSTSKIIFSIANPFDKTSRNDNIYFEMMK